MTFMAAAITAESTRVRRAEITRGLAITRCTFLAFADAALRVPVFVIR
jgi:hypothetical protein